jgi:hypothetical protein
MIAMNLVRPEAAAKHRRLFNKPAFGPLIRVSEKFMSRLADVLTNSISHYA